MKVKKELTARQKTALANHKKKGTKTAKQNTKMNFSKTISRRFPRKEEIEKSETRDES